MAGDWIKMRSNLWDDPRVSRLVDLTESSEAAVVGALYWLWAAADQHTETGTMPGLSLRQIDRKTGIQGFGDALCDVGWLADHPEGVRIVNFEEHNGESAKRRCADAKRKATVRKESAGCPQESGQKTESSGEVAELEKEKEKEKEIKHIVPDKPGTPDCPHQEIIDLYHEHIPTGTQVRIWNDARRKHLQARWREDADRQNLEWWRKFFAYCARSPFLSGQVPPSNGHAQFVLCLDWIVNPTNFAKIIEGRYHEASA
jgi:hypothetical protein